MKRLLGLILLAPFSCYASNCIDVINNIHADIKHYTKLVSHQNLPWMKLAWLEKNLGKARKATTHDNQVKYVWECHNGIYLSVRVDPVGNLTKVSGQYSNDQGSGLFYTFLKKSIQPN